MCGIAGFTTEYPSDTNLDLVRSMVGALRHRGPDAQGVMQLNGAVLGHARLSIIDLSEAGNQPFVSEDGRYAMVFNGEIYNFQSLRKSLEEQGVRFRTQTDTEVVMVLLIREGMSAIEKLNGMFAIAFWDSEAGTLDLIRDRIGKKPLYYTERDGQLIFASELKAILVCPNVPRDIRPDAVYDFFAYQYVPDPKTIFENIFKLEPGSHLHRTRAGLIKIRRYWSPEMGEPESISMESAKAQLLDLIEDATKQRMISDVPLGAFLSGGVDSSGVVAMMAKGGNTVTTCSIGFAEKTFNETEFAQTVADQYRTDHRVHTVRDGVAERLLDICRFLDEPFADSSLVPTFLVSELARQDVTVALTGDGGDEIFAGYQKYATDWRENQLRNKCPSALRTVMGQLAPALRRVPNKHLRRAGSLMQSLSLDSAKAFYVTNSSLDDHIWQLLLNEDFRKTLGDYHPSELTEQAYHRCNSKDHLSRLLYTDMRTYLPGDILVKADRMSMANSLELRSPLLDYRIIEFANQLPSALKFNKGDKKIVLRTALSPLLPPEILNRKKMGFSTPLAQWLRGELKAIAEHYLFDKGEGLDRLFRKDHVKLVWDQHQRSLFDHSALLWSMLMYEIWWQRYLGETRVEKAEPEALAKRPVSS
ncbi:asparagine synthase (glutamine-hydrolyzing) [Marinobacter sp. chi1]|uniref:asparagine synthase (glutamine-hydrolyzing) n=1 Tax=Marinobacter suaedae TaxID=3057675 RepID=A0ABT8W2V9_9GAMM|nr:asparagine synthase (glutamine-hydrolyzing) [Marinobacter sp. chi1]MDO3722585.1 asparagine synthase (glutamine-hydrolyzing) [Marinobacter sp. chi1]